MPRLGDPDAERETGTVRALSAIRRAASAAPDIGRDQQPRFSTIASAAGERHRAPARRIGGEAAGSQPFADLQLASRLRRSAAVAAADAEVAVALGADGPAIVAADDHRAVVPTDRATVWAESS